MMKTNEKLREEIINKLKEFVVSEEKETISTDTVLEDTGIDSLSLISFIVQIEKTYNIEFDDEYLEEIMLSSVNSLIEVTASLLEEGN